MATLPRPVRSYSITPAAATIAAAGTVAATNRLVLLALPAAWHAAGISTLDYCCNAVVAGVKGDGVERWNVSGDIVGNTPTNPHSWRVETLHGGLGQVCIDRNNTTDGSGEVFFSEAVGFTGGTTTARPTAADEVNISSTVNILHTVNGTNVIHLWRCTDSGREGMRMAITNTGALAGPCHLMLIEKASSTPAAWTTKNAGRVMSGAGTFGNRGDWTAAGVRCRVSGTARQPLAIGDTPPSAVDVDGDVLMVPCGLNDATVGRLGFLDDFHFVADTATKYSTFSDLGGAMGWVKLDEVVWPWDHATAFGPNVAGAKILTNYFSAQGDGKGPIISAVTPPSPGELNADPVTARYTPVGFTITDPDGIKDIVVTCGLAGDPEPLLVFDNDGYRGRFAGRSTVQSTGSPLVTQMVFRILPAGGWRRAIDELKVNGYDVFGKQEGIDV